VNVMNDRMCSLRPRLDTFLDGELAESEKAAFEEHLASCPSCAAEAFGRLRLRETTRLAGRRFTPAPALVGRVMRVSRLAKTPGWTWPLAAAAAVVLAAGVAALAVQRTNRELAFGELADLHAANLAGATRVEIASSDQHVVKPWFQGRVPFSVSLPDTLPPPWRLEGGRVTFVDQLPAAHLLFEVRRHEISVFVLQDRPDVRRRFGDGPRIERTYNVTSWSAGGLRWIAVGDVGMAELKELGRVLAAASS
jgi:anti-sigma factor RsiW